MHAFSHASGAIERCRVGLERLLELVPPEARGRVEVHPRSATEVGLLLHGLEFARGRHRLAARSFAHEDELTFGAGLNETPLTEENEGLCRELLARLFLSRHADGVPSGPQVPALSSGDRGLLDLLTIDRNGRLAVVELKADEDLHLPMQALDYWIRVRALNEDRQAAAAGLARLSLRAPGLLRGRGGLSRGTAASARRPGTAHSPCQ
jgi:hypothetical protein